MYVFRLTFICLYVRIAVMPTFGGDYLYGRDFYSHPLLYSFVFCTFFLSGRVILLDFVHSDEHCPVRGRSVTARVSAGLMRSRSSVETLIIF